MRRLLLHNIGLKIAALALSILFWKSVASDPQVASFVSVPVQFRGLPEELELSSNVFESVYVEVRGPSEQLGTYRESNPALVLDMASVRPGQRTFNVDEKNLNLGRGLRLVRAIPAQLRFEFEPRATRDVPVQVRFTRSPPRGYGIASFEVRPEQVRIAGPQSRVARVRQVLTDPIDLSEVVGTAEFRVNAFVEDPLVRFTEPSPVAVRVTIRKT
jgi:YbbR domain-containing protein